MTKQHERAAELLARAGEDRHALGILIGPVDVTDGIAGFHAQQAVEKALKAVLACKGIAFRKTHDIAELLDLLKDGGIAYPESFEEATALVPYAVELRYDSVPAEANPPAPLDRERVLALVDSILAWCRGTVSSEGRPSGA